MVGLLCPVAAHIFVLNQSQFQSSASLFLSTWAAMFLDVINFCLICQKG